ncbi:MAG: (d)CMP kinase [Chromatiaceae bacterium]|nr:(d)CMP kinase [Chromatiaceae bacterium]
MTAVPVVTIDGPSGTGKGTIAELLAKRLGWHCLDSGALYRALGLAAQRRGIDLDAAEPLARLAAGLRLEFRDARVLLDGADVSALIRTETAGGAASRVAAHAAVREVLLDWQRAAACPPGLVADGRDMGSVVFPDAPVKVFLTASPEERAARRYKQLKDKGMDVSLPALVAEIEARDARDRGRAVAPLVAPRGALVVDTTSLAIPEVLDRVLAAVRRVFPG